MKKIVMTMVALLTLTAAVAQNNKKERRAPKEITPEQMTDRMAEGLRLTDDQKTKLLELNTEYKDVLRGPGMHRGPRGPRPDAKTGATEQQGQQKQRPERPQLTEAQQAEMKKQMEKRKEYDGKLKQILTDEQYKDYQKMQPRRGQGHGPGGHRGQRPDQAKKD